MYVLGCEQKKGYICTLKFILLLLMDAQSSRDMSAMHATRLLIDRNQLTGLVPTSYVKAWVYPCVMGQQQHHI